MRMGVKAMSNLPGFVWIGLALALFLALLDWPYGYYQFLRLAVCAGAAFIAFATWRASPVWGCALVALALLFNPLVPVHFERGTWALIDAGAGVLLLAHWWVVGRTQGGKDG
jgi:hypothetical protein